MKKRFLSMLMVLAMALMLLPVGALADTGTLNYLDKDGKKQTYSGEYTNVKDTMTEWSAGWYVVSGNVTITERITVTGNVNLLLSDSCTLNANKGITVNEGNSLTIYAQSIGDSTGKLVANASGVDNCSGIGADGSKKTGNHSGSITICGGDITAAGGKYGAGIGGGDEGEGSNIAISGSTVTATGGSCGAGIGGGYHGAGSNITITNSTVVAKGVQAAGIGGGNNGNGSNITISGSMVTATVDGQGAGVGGGYHGNGCDIAIINSTVTATGGPEGAGIGGGRDGDGSSITIVDSAVNATGGNMAAGIGGGRYGAGKNITISGSSQVRAQGGKGEMPDTTAVSAGCAIGNGGVKDDTRYYGLLYTDNEPDTSKLTADGWVKYYKPDAGNIKDAEPERITTGNYIPGSGSSTGTTNYRLIHTYVEGEGTVDPAGDIMVRDGEDKTLTFTPNAGYEIGDIVVNHKSVGAVSEYTVKDISGTVNIEVTFVKSGNAVVGTESAKNPSTGASI